MVSLTHGGQNKVDAILQMAFLEWKCLNIDQNITEVGARGHTD